jgi:hypothetical protein
LGATPQRNSRRSSIAGGQVLCASVLCKGVRRFRRFTLLFDDEIVTITLRDRAVCKVSYAMFDYLKVEGERSEFVQSDLFASFIRYVEAHADVAVIGFHFQ